MERLLLPDFTKIDVFFRRERPFDRAEFDRRERVEPAPGIALYVKTPEDSVLRKLLLYRAGGETSERQLRDVVAVLELNRGRPDEAYLDRWAGALGIRDLLESARESASRRPGTGQNTAPPVISRWEVPSIKRR